MIAPARRLAALVLALTLAAVSAPAATFDPSGKQLKADGLKHLQSSQRVLIPTLYAQNLIAGVHKASKGGAHARISAANVGITPELGRRIADSLLADLVAQLKAAGKEVLLYDDVKGNAVVAGLKAWTPHKEHKLPIASVNVGYGAMDYLVSTPTGVPIQQHAAVAVWDAGVAMRYAKVARELDAVVVVPTYRFQCPMLYGSSRGGIHQSYAKVGIVPSMHVAWAGFQILSPKGAWGSYMMNGVDTVELLETVGTIAKTSESKTSDVSLFDFSSFRSMAKSGYLMTVDAEAYQTAAIQAGKELNALFRGQFK